MKKRLIVIVVGDRDEVKGCVAVVGGGAQATACVYRSEKTFVVRSLLPTFQTPVFRAAWSVLTGQAISPSQKK